ncbi:hypothetical protein [Pseudomonas sp. Fl5BN2]|nr:hypothetical protein [Pseudomonas sp. Fl5BN2]
MTEAPLKTVEGMPHLARARDGWCLFDTDYNLSTRLSWRCAGA